MKLFESDTPKLPSIKDQVSKFVKDNGVSPEEQEMTPPVIYVVPANE